MPKVGVPEFDDLFDDRDRVLTGRGRIARTVRQENAVRLHRQNIFGGRLGVDDGDLATLTSKQPQDVAFDAVIDRDDVEFRLVLRAETLVPLPGRLVPVETLGAGDHRHEVHAFEPRPLPRFFLEAMQIEPAVLGVSDHGVRHAFAADQRCQGARVDARQADDAARF